MLFAQRGARTHDPEIKSLMLYRLTVFDSGANVAKIQNFYRQLVQLSYGCHLKGSCMGKFLKKRNSPPFEF